MWVVVLGTISGFASRYASKKIRLVLEDQPEVIAEAKEERNDPRVELKEHSFFEPQPIKHAKIVSIACQTSFASKAD